MFLGQQIIILEWWLEWWCFDHRNKLHFKIYYNGNWHNISQYYWFYCIFNQI